MATSKLQRQFGNMLDKRLPEYRIRENYRPDWMISSDKSRLELDFYIEELKIAFEVQGVQHYQFIEHFHGTYENFEKRRRLDQEKCELCYGRGVRLIEIFTLTDAEIAIKDIEASRINDRDDKYSGATVHRTNRKKPRDSANTEEERIKRLEECKRKLEQYECGEIRADKFLVKAWRDVVENNGLAKSPAKLRREEVVRSRQ